MWTEPGWVFLGAADAPRLGPRPALQEACARSVSTQSIPPPILIPLSAPVDFKDAGMLKTNELLRQGLQSKLKFFFCGAS